MPQRVWILSLPDSLSHEEAAGATTRTTKITTSTESTALRQLKTVP